MKRLFSLFWVAVLTVIDAGAVVAPKTPYPYTQPDGAVVMLVNHGDEFDHWVTCDGVEVERDAAGFYRPVPDAPARRKTRRAAATSLRAEAVRLRAQARSESISLGNKRFLVLLVDFPDRRFTTADARETFSRMLNAPGYADDGATGSVKDYYTENSLGQFVPTFDVYGPVTVSESYAYYGQDIGSDRSGHATQALYEACNLLDSQIDFSLYDNDGDGYVDNTFFFFAGHSQAEGGDADSIWPHQYVMRNYNLVLDGVRIYRYGCASEYKGSSGTRRAGIGTFCHEFGHSLGLLDLYDTDGETNGLAVTPADYSLMASGNYLNEGRTPPYLISIERQMLGWMDDARAFTGGGTYTLGPLGLGTVPYMTAADVEGEYFLYEMRDATGWDAYLPKGLVVYHVDQSLNEIAPGVTARQAWDGHYVNRYGAHPCIYPAYEGTSTFLPTAWSGDALLDYVSRIALEGNDAVLTVERLSDRRQIFGTVMGIDGRPIAGAEVTMAAVLEAPGPLQVRTNQVRPRSDAYAAVTDGNGRYTLFIPDEETGTSFTVSAALDGYVTSAYDVSFRRLSRQDFVLRSVDASPRADLKKFPDSGSAYGRGYATKPQDIMGAVHFSAQELLPYAGMTLETVSFQYAEAEPYAAEEVYVIVDRGGERILTQPVEHPVPYQFLQVDVSAAGIRIPGDKDLYIGYALKGVNANYPILRRAVSDVDDGSYISSFSLAASKWIGESDQAILVSASLLDTEAAAFVNLGAMGFNSIDHPFRESGCSAGDVFPFRLKETPSDRPASVTWYYDGVLQGASSVTLTAGSHQVEARLEYPDGGVEVLTLRLQVH